MKNIDHPSVSVIMTVYNAELFIDEAIRSIIEQTFTDYEFIIIDDGSQDQSVAHIHKYNDPRIVFIPRLHTGRAQSLNYAVLQAKSPILAFMDADDRSVRERLAIQYKMIEEHQEIGVLSSWFYRMTEGGKVKRLVKNPEHHKKISGGMTRTCSILFSASMIRKSLIEQAGGFHDTTIIEDWDLLLRLLPATQFYNIKQPLFYYRQHGNSTTGKHRQQQRRDAYRISHEYLMRKLETAGIIKEQKKILFQLALCEISLGSINSARRYLLKCFSIKENALRWVAYFVLCLPGDALYAFVRSMRDRIKNILLRRLWKVDI